MALGFSRLQTSVICGPANIVLRYSALAPSLEQATVASMKPRWLRQRIPTPSPSPIPRSLHALASALVRWWISRKVSVPSSSTMPILSGRRTLEIVYPAAGVGPQRSIVAAICTARSGRIGRRTPASARTLMVCARLTISSRTCSTGDIAGQYATWMPFDDALRAALGQRQAGGHVAALDQPPDVTGPPRVQEHVALSHAGL